MLDFLNKIDPEKEELIRLDYMLNNAIIKNCDPIWENIVQRAKRIERLRNFPEFTEFLIESPFIQGDVKKEKPTGLPDVIYQKSNFIMGIECFEFDASVRNRKGSKMGRKRLAADNKLQTLIQSEKERPTSVNVPVDVEFSYQNYIESLLFCFREHAKKIEKYRQALRRKYPKKPILLTFYIEDVTEIGNYILTEKGLEALNPLFVKEFVDELSDYDGIDYIVTCFQKMYVHYLFPQRINSLTIKALRNDCFSSADKFFRYKYELCTNLY